MPAARSLPVTASRSAANLQAILSATIIVWVGIGTLVAEAGGVLVLRPLTHAGVLLWFGLNLLRFRGVEMIFVAAAFIVVPLVYALPTSPGISSPWRSTAPACSSPSSPASICCAISAQSSVAVRRAGMFLISQSPPLRYAALSVGCHLFTIALNMGALVLLGAMVRRSNTLAAAGGDPTVVAIRLQRMTTALLRGFGTTLMWTPTGVSLGYTLSLVPAVTWFDVVLPLVGLAIAWMALGWIVDRLQWPPSARRAALPPPPYVSPLEALPMLGITALLLVSVVVAKVVYGSSLLVATLATVPFVAVIWLFMQYRRFGTRMSVAITARRLKRHVIYLLPQTRPECVVLAAAAFIGVGLSAIVQAGGASVWLSGLGLPPAAIAIAVFLLIIGLSQVAVTPLVIATIVGTTVSHMTPMPIPPLALAIAIQSGWSLASAASPYTGGMLTLARVVDKRPADLMRWNLVWGVGCGVVISAVYLVWLG